MYCALPETDTNIMGSALAVKGLTERAIGDYVYLRARGGEMRKAHSETQSNEVCVVELLSGTRVEPFLKYDPVLFEAFKDFVRVDSEEDMEDRLVNRQEVVDLICMFYALKSRTRLDSGFWQGCSLCPSFTDFRPDDEEVTNAFLRLKQIPGNYRVCRKHFWTYVRDAWKTITGSSLPGRRNDDFPLNLELDLQTERAYHFALSLTYLVKHLEHSAQ